MMMFDWTHKRARLSGDKTAILDPMGNRELSYRQLDERASRLAEVFMRRYGLQPGERVAMLCQHSAEFYEALFACAKAGLILVPMNWRLAVAEQEFVLRDCEPKLLIFDGVYAEAAQALEASLGIPALGFGEGEPDFESALAEASGEPVIMPARQQDEPWYLIYTSGTTGKPKGVVQTLGMALVNYLDIGVPSNLTAEDVSLNLLPQFHVGGINLYTLPTLIVGGTAIILRSFEPELTFKLLAERVTVFFGVPAVYLMLIQHPEFKSTDFSRVRVWASGGAPLPVRIIEDYADYGIRIRQGFGMSETGPTVFLIDSERAIDKAGSVGMPQLFIETRIVDEQERDVATGQAGELLVRGPSVTPGYWNLPEKTAESFTQDGWFRSGDIARCDADGYYYIVDRSKDMYISGGENVYPAEVENVIYEHPAVAETAVIGVPDERWGEVGLAVVVRRTGEALEAEELLRFCKARLAGYKVPKRVEFMDALPRNAGGKVVKPALRERFGG
ncbi:acyl-CoA synthetase [Alkalilimnicola sp. S0819]|uniref:acyl-CoA synthetase n=1 Tax=Alkalilimnicola sp. S0819 TaxID=2613922 RepID=UPI0012614565|nr:long-chain fatty acid--CoA ligase [Alkalilimnicola sp. S0819]KAB7619579.1 long-chain fatty acid--CoA ligase [Alkalilimnicola sp. S0819]MPQ17632.1 long-chain-fatty-acid--CoA ligase [Alkalilimnicola sp. S0819]